VIIAVVLACAAIVVPFGVRALERDARPDTSVTRTTPPPTTDPGVGHRQHRASDGALGSHSDLPALLPARTPSLRDGQAVRIGDITEGTLRRAPAGWQVVVRWDGRLQPLATRGPVSLATASWVSRAGLLYSRVPTGTPGRFHVYAWDAQGGTAYTPPTLVATALGEVCFNQAFTAFGGCPQTRS
jgi:hypothetical protein